MRHNFGVKKRDYLHTFIFWRRFQFGEFALFKKVIRSIDSQPNSLWLISLPRNCNEASACNHNQRKFPGHVKLGLVIMLIDFPWRVLSSLTLITLCFSRLPFLFALGVSEFSIIQDATDGRNPFGGHYKSRFLRGRWQERY